LTTVTAAILLAAGESTRMGRPKALLPWGEARAHSRAPLLIEYQVRELRAAGVDDVVAVLGHGADEVSAQVPPEARVVVNEAYLQGRASSLRAGAAALPDSADPIVILSVDQPRPREVLAALLAAHAESGALVTLPTYEGRRGHPAVVGGALLAELRAATEEARGLRGVLAAHEAEVREVDLGTPAVRLDINTEEDYRRALGGRGPTLD
jgi:CTP:molybdopterin cytidylyltransferase MocA